MWSSYRKFIVDRIVRESASAQSFYLVAADDGPLAPYAPGQHLPLRLNIPGSREPVFRFYTLSDCHNGRYYRLTIKKELSPPGSPDAPPGLSSTFFNDVVRVGDVIEAKAPGGRFFLDVRRQHPLVFIAGGIGVTPLLSMVNAVVECRSTRDVWLFFAVRHGGDHVFKGHLRGLAGRHPNIRLCVLYDEPRPQDQLGRDYDRAGRVDVRLLLEIPPTLDMEYFVCGPGPMMMAVVGGLTATGVAADRVRTESFGPSSALAYGDDAHSPAAAAVGKSAAQQASACNGHAMVTFRRSGKVVPWDPSARSLWHLAEAHGVEIPSGCLYGECATCLTGLLQGDVAYSHMTAATPDPRTCLPCSCKPVGHVTLDV